MHFFDTPSRADTSASSADDESSVMNTSQTHGARNSFPRNFERTPTDFLEAMGLRISQARLNAPSSIFLSARTSKMLRSICADFDLFSDSPRSS